MYDYRAIAAQFEIPGTWRSVQPYGHGHINDSYAATFDQAGRHVRYLLQRINHQVFKDPEAVVENIARVTDHLRRKGAQALTLVQTTDGKYLHRDSQGNFWRTYFFVEGAESFEVVRDAAQAGEAARAFGRFQHLLADLPGPRLHETIPAFHDTPARYRALLAAIADDPRNRAQQAGPEIKFALRREPAVAVLQDAWARGKIPERIAHNDTKLNNVLFDRAAGAAVCVTDLDTVMPGLALHDFGDLVRTMTSPAAEDERDLSKVVLQLPMFEALVRGYLDEAGLFLNAAEKDLLAFSGKLVTLETGIRFLTDFLLGDAYFKTERDDQNLDRCRTQFLLVAHIERQEDRLQAMVDRYS